LWLCFVPFVVTFLWLLLWLRHHVDGGDPGLGDGEDSLAAVFIVLHSAGGGCQ
jgi:hypothetical protein